MDASTDALQPRDSQAYATLNAIKEHLNQKRDPLWLVVAGHDENEVARRLAAVESTLDDAVANRVLTGFVTPTALWPRPAFQAANRATAQRLVAEREGLRAAALAGGFSEDALGLTGSLLDTWQRAAASGNVFWPTNPLCTWIMEKLAVREPESFYAVGFLFPPTNSIDSSAFTRLEAQLPRDGVWLAGWELLGGTVLGVVKGNLWKLLLPMVGLVLLSLWFAFRRFAELALSVGVLAISGLCLLAVMNLMGWSWNVLNLMALPLILGTGVDYSIFMQLALRRHHGDLRVAHRSVGRALLLCGGTAVSGFGSLALSSNAGMASLGQVCAVGIGCNMAFSVFLLPIWWRRFASRSGTQPCGAANASAPSPAIQPGTNPPRAATPAKQSSLYRAEVWSLGLLVVRVLPTKLGEWLGRRVGAFYCLVQPRRLEVVIKNLLPVLNGNRVAATQAARALFQEFALKVIDLWRFESGEAVDQWLTDLGGWEIFAAAHARGKGVLLVTPHLGNWEFGGAVLAKRGFKLLVLTQPEPGRGFTQLRQDSRARWGIETLVVGEDAFAFVEIIKRLQDGATVALLVDRPPAPTAVTVELFGRPFQGSMAAAELARASGCAIVPTFLVRKSGRYHARILPEIGYDRAAIGDRAARIRLTQEITRAFEPAIRQHPEQWYHFVPIWPPGAQRE
jgi:lauroyl/myristoyl acyltransferase